MFGTAKIPVVAFQTPETQRIELTVNTKMIEIRKEKKEDFGEVYRVNLLAFAREDEAKLVERLRNVESYISLVAEINGEIAGHIAFTPVTVEDAKTEFTGLAPMAVLPEFQNQGIGSKLVSAGLKVCAENGLTAVFVLGHSHYYPRFGFETAKLKGFACEYPSPDESFMVLELVTGALKGRHGLVKYRPEFPGF